MTVKYPVRGLWVVVAVLAVAPGHAQTPPPVWKTTTPGRTAAAFPNEAQAPAPASDSTNRGKTPESVSPTPPQAMQAPATEPGSRSHRGNASLPIQKVSKKSMEADVSQIGNRPVGKGVNLYSLEKEQQLGRQLALELEMQVRLLDDPVITEYVNRVGQNLVRNSDSEVPFTIKVIDDDEINAMALPGGYFYVNSGLVMAADNEAELAGVMAHEIAHVACRHATRALTRGRIWNVASIPLIFVGGGAGYAIRQLVSVGFPMSSLKFSRDAEREADLLGLEYQYAAGYDPGEFVQFFEKVHALEKRQKHSFVSKLFSSHPMTEDRIKRAQGEVATLLPPRDQYVVSTSEFDEVKVRLAGSPLKLNRPNKGDRPTLRRRTSSQIDDEDRKSDGADADDRPPSLKRKLE